MDRPAEAKQRGSNAASEAPRQQLPEPPPAARTTSPPTDLPEPFQKPIRASVRTTTVLSDLPATRLSKSPSDAPRGRDGAETPQDRTPLNNRKSDCGKRTSRQDASRADPPSSSSRVQAEHQGAASRLKGSLQRGDGASEDEMELFILMEDQNPEKAEPRRKKRCVPGKRKRESKPEEDDGESAVPTDMDNPLDRNLDDRAKQHNLTVVNVRNILHEVITNEHVVAMMKAAITDTQGLPPFEPKMTRSKLKEVVEKGVVIPTWNLSPVKKASDVKVPQFVDIPLEEEDSSDEEYRPEEEEEYETAEENLLESDIESTSSSPRGHKRQRSLPAPDSAEESMDCQQTEARPPVCGSHVSPEIVPMGPPPPPKEKSIQDSTFMEELHAVDEELARSHMCMEPFQTLDDSLIAFRTRSKRPLKDVPIGQLEAALKAPDITPDMYDPNTADDEDWKMWLRSLMEDDLGNEDEADDDDDPEYNILDDLDEPDTEDLRNDRAVRITKKEVNNLMEELFETFQDEVGFSHVEEDGPEDEDSNSDTPPDFNTPQAMRFQEPLANLLNQHHRTVKAQLEFLRMRKSMWKPAGQEESEKGKSPQVQAAEEKHPAETKAAPVLGLNAEQKRRLQQQMQQHVQLLTQMHLLACRNPGLSAEAENARVFLIELSSFAETSVLSYRPANPDFQSMFQAWNLKKALQLLCSFHSRVPESSEPPKVLRKNASEIIGLSSDVAWIVATRPLFMYPELLPVCGLKATGPRDRVFFTKAEDSLLVLGLKHFEGTEFTKPLISKYLVVAKTAQQLTARVRNLTMKRSPDNIIKFFKKTKSLPVMIKCCEDVQPYNAKPPLEREKHRLPHWLKASLPSIEAAMKKPPEGVTERAANKYPLLIPSGLTLELNPVPGRFYHKAWRQKRSSILKPLLIRPGNSSSANPSGLMKPLVKSSLVQTVPVKIMDRLPSFVPVQGIVGVNPLSFPIVARTQEVCYRVPSEARGSSGCPVQFAGPPIKVTAPPLAAQRVRKPFLGGGPRRKIAAKGPCFRAAPFAHSPLILAVPNTALKLVSLGAPCGVIQPVTSSPGIPLATVLLNPSTIPVAQTLVPSRLGESLVPVPPALPKMEQNESKPFGDAAAREDGKDCVSVKVEEHNGEEGGKEGTGQEGGKEYSGRRSPVEDGDSADRTDAAAELSTSVEEESFSGSVLSPHDSRPQEKPDCDPAVQPASPRDPDTQEKDGEGERAADPEPSDTRLVEAEHPTEPEDVQNPDGEMAQDPPEGQAAGGHESPQNTTSPTEMDASSPAETSHNASSPLGQQQDAKDGPDEEEEEDFGDLTQDEDEELSSASEESVLSVPELQETMEKLTWLASERRLSQEGDSEENSQEENSEPEEEEEDGEEALESSVQKEEEEMTEAIVESSASPPVRPSAPSPAPPAPVMDPADKTPKGSNKSRSSHRVRSARGRTRTSKDASKLLHLYDENILLKDPMREQKDMAFAQEYLNRVREALRFVPGKYEQFLHLIYQFESSRNTKTAVDLYENLREILGDWPQLLRDFAAFLLPEQALECGLFQEQQAFDKSRKFLRQLEICFLENPPHYQKIIKLLQSCVERPLQEINKLKAQMWRLLKGHNNLQDEFSLFFDQLRPPAGRGEDFEVVNWTGDKEYKFDGFEEVTLPDVEEEEEAAGKIPPLHRSRKRKESHPGQDVDSVDGGKDSACSYHEAAEQRVKRCKKRMSSKGPDSRSHRTKKAPEGAAGRSHGAVRFEEAGTGEGKLPLPKGSGLEDRLPAAARGKGSSAHHHRVTMQKSRTASRAQSVPVTDRKSRAKPPRGVSTGRSVHKPKAVEASDPALPAHKALHGGHYLPACDRVEGVPACSPPPSMDDNDLSQPRIPESTETQEKPLMVCAKNIAVSSSGEKVILWTREADRIILTVCQERGAQEEAFAAISEKLGNKSPAEVSERFRELVRLFQTSCGTSSDEEEATEEMSEPEAVSEED
ncbi:GON-4-like protein [Spea bombifrons]|uniref:GON-4-like protein n=1 Tax=Spea bombifrons TaxID=233779 RepID=UPI00234C018E|nr:GON-4-like protein [Spea bombifrons]